MFGTTEKGSSREGVDGAIKADAFSKSDWRVISPGGTKLESGGEATGEDIGDMSTKASTSGLMTSESPALPLVELCNQPFFATISNVIFDRCCDQRCGRSALGMLLHRHGCSTRERHSQ